MGATTLIFSVMSVALASNDILDKEKIDKVLKEQWLTERYQIEVPSTVTFQSEYERIQFIDIYVTESVHLEGNPKLFIESVHGETDISKLADTLTQIRRKIEDWHSPAKCVLHIDKDVPMSAVRNIKEQIRSADIRLLMYSTGLVNNVYPSSHPRLKYVGINEAMAPASQKMIAFLDSAEQLDRSKYRIKLHDSWLYRNGFIKTYNRIRVDVNADTVLLNGRPTTRDELSQVAYEFMKKFSQNGCIIYDVDDDASYEQYIKYLDVLYTAVDKLRREYSLEMYNEPFDEWSEHNSEVNERYPRAIVQWNAEERRLEQLMKNW
jgi:biopolymer transport protein ExbD